MKRQIMECCDLAGGVGTAIIVACCLGVGPLLAFFSWIGLVFFADDRLLQFLLVTSLAITLFGLVMGVRAHACRWPLVLGFVSAFWLWAFIYLIPFEAAAYVAGTFLLISIASNTWYRCTCDIVTVGAE